MNEVTWRERRDSRTMRYAGRVFDPKRWITLTADPEYAVRYDGQVAIITTANLLCRMTPAVALHIPEVPIVPSLPGAGLCLRKFLLNSLFEADPYGKFNGERFEEHDYRIHLGRNDAPHVVHGSGWNAYCGPSPSPLTDDDSINPTGPALAAIVAASEAFRTNLGEPPQETLLNSLTWQRRMVDTYIAPLGKTITELGNLWVVGTGSVGTAILYFLTLAMANFCTTLFDGDVVEVPNLDRSPIFVNADVGKKKVEVTRRWLERSGISAKAEPYALHESEVWRNREEGAPDLMISAANEYNVRSLIEGGFPPLQIYGTTGNNWQAAMIRHVPMRDPCSRCLFPEGNHKKTLCATMSVSEAEGTDEKNVDAALPFLSFAAGAMAAAEILKVCLPGYPFSNNRVILYTKPSPRLVSVRLPLRDDCVCCHRSVGVHHKMIDASRYGELSCNIETKLETQSGRRLLR